MSRDLWLKQLRTAGRDTRSVENLMAGEVQVDGLQHAGDALLHAGYSERLGEVGGSLIEALGQRGWTGDPELITELEHYSKRRNHRIGGYLDTRWHRFRDDAHLGRARAWLAGHDCRSNGRSVRLRQSECADLSMTNKRSDLACTPLPATAFSRLINENTFRLVNRQ